jgi:hypothetical protein
MLRTGALLGKALGPVELNPAHPHLMSIQSGISGL